MNWYFIGIFGVIGLILTLYGIYQIYKVIKNEVCEKKSKAYMTMAIGIVLLFFAVIFFVASMIFSVL